MRSGIPILLLLLAAAGPSASAAILFQVDQRSVSASGEPCTEPAPGEIECGPYESESFTPSVPFGAFDATANAAGNGANQHSSVDLVAGSMSANGTADSYSDVGYASGTSIFEIGFELTGPTSIVLEGWVLAEEYYGFGEGRALVRLFQGTSVVYEAAAIVNSDYAEEMVDYQGVLGPGTYTIRALADGYGGSWSSYTLSFTSTAVPEPGTGALAAAGLVALAAVRRRRGEPIRRTPAP